MKVLLWRQDLLPGSETFVRQQAEVLAAQPGVDVVCAGVRRVESVLSSPDDVVLFEENRRDRLLRRQFESLHSSRRVERLLEMVRPDVVHAHFVNEAFPLRRIVGRRGIPLVTTAHGYDVTKMPGSTRERAQYRRRARAVLRSSAAVVCVSRFIQDQVDELGGPGTRSVVHYTGIAIPELAEPRTTAQRSGILFVGRLVAKKGVADLLRALALLRDRGRTSILTVVGDGPDRSTLLALSQELGLLVEFLGAQPPDVVAALMKKAQVFAAPSRTAPDGDSEGLGHVFLEAQAQELPVVAYAHGGVPEAVVPGRTGLLVEEGDVPALAAAMERLLMDEGLARAMGRAAREHVIQHFDIERQTGELLEIYKKAARR